MKDFIIFRPFVKLFNYMNESLDKLVEDMAKETVEREKNHLLGISDAKYRKTMDMILEYQRLWASKHSGYPCPVSVAYEENTNFLGLTYRYYDILCERRDDPKTGHYLFFYKNVFLCDATEVTIDFYNRQWNEEFEKIYKELQDKRIRDKKIKEAVKEYEAKYGYTPNVVEIKRYSKDSYDTLVSFFNQIYDSNYSLIRDLYMVLKKMNTELVEVNTGRRVTFDYINPPYPRDEYIKKHYFILDKDGNESLIMQSNYEVIPKKEFIEYIGNETIAKNFSGERYKRMNNLSMSWPSMPPRYETWEHAYRKEEKYAQYFIVNSFLYYMGYIEMLGLDKEKFEKDFQGDLTIIISRIESHNEHPELWAVRNSSFVTLRNMCNFNIGEFFWKKMLDGAAYERSCYGRKNYYERNGEYDYKYLKDKVYDWEA